MIVLKCLSFESPNSQEPLCCKSPLSSLKADSSKETIVERLKRGLPFPWRALRDVNDWRPIWRRPWRQNFGCNLFLLLFNEWLRLWFHSVIDYVNMSSILSNWYLVTYAGFYACICLFLACAGVHPRRSWRIVICRGWGTGTLSSSDRSIGFQVGFYL